MNEHTLENINISVVAKINRFFLLCEKFNGLINGLFIYGETNRTGFAEEGSFVSTDELSGIINNSVI